MAYNFLGTLSSPQLQDFRSFLEAQIVDIDEEINYLYVEMNSLRQTLTDFSKADNHFGGEASSVLYETQLHDLVKRIKQDDRAPADLMAKIKKPFVSTIKYKREKNEYKMKKLLDAVEQAKESIDRKAIAKSQTRDLLNQLEQMLNSNNSNTLFKSEVDRKNYAQGVIAPTATPTTATSKSTKDVMIIVAKFQIGNTTRTDIRVVDVVVLAPIPGLSRGFTNDEVSAQSYLDHLKQEYPSAKVEIN